MNNINHLIKSDRHYAFLCWVNGYEIEQKDMPVDYVEAVEHVVSKHCKDIEHIDDVCLRFGLNGNEPATLVQIAELREETPGRIRSRMGSLALKIRRDSVAMYILSNGLIEYNLHIMREIKLRDEFLDSRCHMTLLQELLKHVKLWEFNIPIIIGNALARGLWNRQLADVSALEFLELTPDALYRVRGIGKTHIEDIEVLQDSIMRKFYDVDFRMFRAMVLGIS